MSDDTWKLIEDRKRLKKKVHSAKNEGEQQEIRKYYRYVEVEKKH